MFDKTFGTRPPANDEPDLRQAQDRSLDAAIEHCVQPETIRDALHRSGFGRLKQAERFGILSEYVAVKP